MYACAFSLFSPSSSASFASSSSSCTSSVRRSVVGERSRAARGWNLNEQNGVEGNSETVLRARARAITARRNCFKIETDSRCARTGLRRTDNFGARNGRKNQREKGDERNIGRESCNFANRGNFDQFHRTGRASEPREILIVHIGMTNAACNVSYLILRDYTAGY